MNVENTAQEINITSLHSEAFSLAIKLVKKIVFYNLER